jgi:hypothetical protein
MPTVTSVKGGIYLGKSAMQTTAKIRSLYGDIWCNAFFRRYVYGQSLSMIGDAVCLTALPLALLFAGYDAIAFGGVMASVGFGTILGAIIGGPWTEKMAARDILVITDIVRGAISCCRNNRRIRGLAVADFDLSMVWVRHRSFPSSGPPDVNQRHTKIRPNEGE